MLVNVIIRTINGHTLLSLDKEQKNVEQTFKLSFWGKYLGGNTIVHLLQ